MLTIYEGKFVRLKDDRDNLIKAKEALELADPGTSASAWKCVCVCVWLVFVCVLCGWDMCVGYSCVLCACGRVCVFCACTICVCVWGGGGGGYVCV